MRIGWPSPNTGAPVSAARLGWTLSLGEYPQRGDSPLRSTVFPHACIIAQPCALTHVCVCLALKLIVICIIAPVGSHLALCGACVRHGFSGGALHCCAQLLRGDRDDIPFLMSYAMTWDAK